MADSDNKLVQLEDALKKLSAFLDNPAVKTALGQVPASIKTPVMDGLKKVLDVVKKALKELKDNLGAVTTVKDLLGVVNDLMTAVEGLAPGEKDTLDSVRNIVKTLQDLPSAEKMQAILELVDQIVTKLGAL